MRMLVQALIAAIFLGSSCTEAEELQVDDVTLHYTVHGEGSPLLLVHGLSSSGQDSWSALIPGYEKHFKVYVLDLRGHGKSTFSQQLFTHRLAAQDILAFLNKLKIHKVRAIGASSGANALLHLAAMAPNQIRSMVLVCGGHYMPEQGREKLRRAIAEPAFQERLARVHVGGQPQWDYVRRSALALSENYTDMNFSPPLLGTIQTPTLIMHGDRDEFFPLHLPVELYGSLPNAQLWILPNKGHMLIYPPGAEEEMERLFLQRTIQFFEAAEQSERAQSR